MPTPYLRDKLPERFPLSCQWEITCRCNLHCVMCYTDCFNRPERIKEELSTGEILRIIDELAEAGCLELCLTGGEPFARSDFFPIYEHAKAKGFLITIFTNGTLITKTVADRLADLPPFRIEVSLHGLSEPTFETVTQGPGSYDRCMAAIRLLVERNLPLVLKTTAMSINKNELLKIKRFVSSLGSVGYKLGEELRPALDGDETPRQLSLTDPELIELNRQDSKLWEEACHHAVRPKPPCMSGHRTFHIDAYGQLQLCSGNRADSYDLRHGSFKEGFYEHLPTFSCPWKSGTPASVIQLSTHHA